MLSFFVSKLVAEGGQKKAAMYLRHQHAGGDKVADLSATEASLTAFCFPLGPENCLPKEYMASEEYTFTLTGGDGRRYHGFCRKFLPPKPVVGSRLQLPQVMCLMSEDPWATFFFKVLQVLEQLVKAEEGLLGSDAKQLPSTSHTAVFLQDLGTQLSLNPRPSEIVRVALPQSVDLMGASPQRLLGNTLALSAEQLELQVPLDCGNGRWNCGVSLARLLWDVPVPALTTLLASMLLERRIILVSSQRDTVTAAVQAASALLYPFKWHHIYLPMLPQAFKDYLSAPMPFMVGLQSQMLHTLSSIPMDEITVIDLDIRSCRPAPGSPGDDGRSLPWREHLEAALAAAHRVIRSPTEHETSPLIASIMQEFYLKLIGNFRRFIHADTPALNARWAAQLAAAQGPTSQNSPRTNHRESSSGRAPLTDQGERQGGGGGNRGPQASDNVIKASGYVFEHTAFVRSHRRNDKARAFLNHFRGSQMYAMFVQEKLEEAAAAAQGHGDPAPEDPFEVKVNRYQERRRARFEKLRANKGSGVIARQWNSLIKKHRRTDSEEAAMMGNLDLGGGGVTSGIRRIITYPNNNMAGSSPPLDIDPASFFPDDDDEDYEDLVASGAGTGRLDGMEPGEGRVLSANGAQAFPHHALDRSSASFAVPGPSGLHQHNIMPTNHRLATSRLQGSQQPDMPQGMTVTIAPDGHKVYEGSFGSMLKSAVTDLTSALSRRVNSGNPSLTSTSSSSGAAALPQPVGYRPQLTGDSNPARGGLARYMPQTTGGGLGLLDVSNVLDMANGRLRPPPASSRPLLMPQQQGSSSSANVGELPAFGASPSGAPMQPASVSLPSPSGAQQRPVTPLTHVPLTLSPATSAMAPSPTGSRAGSHVNGQQGASTAPLLDGFDGFSVLASAHAAPSPQPSGTAPGQGVSLLDM